jgi:calcium/calmodulin-dependent protein kinase I
VLIAKGFILSLLNPDPYKRPTSEDALKHRWLTGESATGVDLLSDITSNFNARKTFKKAIDAVQAGIRMKRVATTKFFDEDEDQTDTVVEPVQIEANKQEETTTQT